MRLRTILPVAVLAVSAVFVAAPASNAALPSDLVMLYSFDTDSSTTIKDSTTHALNGQLVNADPTTAFVTGAPGRGKALRLVATQHQYVAVPQSNLLDVNRFTLAAWVRYTGVQTADTLDRWEVLEKAGAYWLNIRTNGKVRAGGFFGGCLASTYWHYLDSTRAVPVNTWTHVAARYNGTRLALFINGTAAGSMAVSGTTCANDEPLAVGAKNAPAKGILEAFWDGRLDDVRIYNVALSTTRIAALAG
jgi:hypothetical protein